MSKLSQWRIKRQCWSFTLIELLTVVVIIAILAALSTTAMRPIRATMQQTQCSNNMRQIGTGLFAYAADHDNALPPVFLVKPSDASGEQSYWSSIVWTYVYPGTTTQWPENTTQFNSAATYKWKPNAFRCPTTSKGAIKAPTVGALSDARASYGLNNTMMIVDSNGGWVDGRMSPIPLARMTRAGQTAMVLEACNFDASFSTYSSQVGIIPHKGGANVLFFDGHVEWRVFADIPAGSYSVHTNVFWRGY